LFVLSHGEYVSVELPGKHWYTLSPTVAAAETSKALAEAHMYGPMVVLEPSGTVNGARHLRTPLGAPEPVQ